MAANQSVEKFKRLTEDLKQEVRDAAIDELNKQAKDLADLIRFVAPVDEGGLKHSVGVIPSAKGPTQVRVIAGGKLTVRPSVSSKPYDYARADEFGTVNMPAHPFFFPTYRLRKKKIIAEMKKRIRANIKVRSAE